MALDIKAVVPCLLGVVYSAVRFARLWADSKNVIKQGDMVEILSVPDGQMYSSYRYWITSCIQKWAQAFTWQEQVRTRVPLSPTIHSMPSLTYICWRVYTATSLYTRSGQNTT